METFVSNIFSRISGILKKPFVRNVTIVASGTAAAQAITMAFSPLITRIYGAEAFGLLGVFNALVSVVTPIAALTYPIAIVLPQEDTEAKGLVKLSSLIAFVVFIIVSIVLLIGGKSLLAMLDSEAIAPYVMLVPLSVFFTAFVQIAQQWLIRKKLFGISAKVAMLQSFLLNIAKTGIGLIKPVGAVLVILSTLGYGLHSLLLWFGIKKSGELAHSVTNKEKSKISLKNLAWKYYDFPLYRAPQGFLNAISQGLPVLMLASFFGSAAAGFYSIGRTVLAMPSTLVGQAVGDVFYPRITEAFHRGEDLTRLILKATIALAVVGFLPFAVIVAFGPQVFSFVFGGEWVKAGEYARWMALWLFFSFLNRPSVVAIATLSIQRFFLIFEIVTMMTRVAGLALGFLIFKDDVMATMLFSLSGMLLNIYLIFKTLKYAKSLRKIL
mgnify:FL=1